jgi:hypothetical protein
MIVSDLNQYWWLVRFGTVIYVVLTSIAVIIFLAVILIPVVTHEVQSHNNRPSA